MKIKVYTKDICVQCKATKKALDKLGLPYTEEKIDDTNRDYLIGLNLLSAPVVMVDYPSGKSEVWSGFRPDSLNALVE